MAYLGGVWRLSDHDGRALGAILVTKSGFPWLEGVLTPEAGFGEVRALFDEDIRLMQPLIGDDDSVDPGEWDEQAWEAVHARIAAAVCLIDPDGRTVPEFLLHVEGTDAWWRWSDTTFDES
ncbi:hypothetical protein ACWKSP_11780 [Micromonosporaceae bacterium Da 78-11]